VHTIKVRVGSGGMPLPILNSEMSKCEWLASRFSRLIPGKKRPQYLPSKKLNERQRQCGQFEDAKRFLFLSGTELWSLGLPGHGLFCYYYDIIDISFMQGVYTCVSETNHVPREHCVADILMLLLFMVPRSLVPALTPLYLYVSTFGSMCTVPNMAVFCSSLTS
jgi:hypothetical protein